MVKSRLSKDVIPLSYKLHLAPDLQTSTFSGSVEIELEFKVASFEIEFHSLVNISSYLLTSGGLGHSPTNVANDGSVVTLKFSTSFAVGSLATLSLSFTGELNDKLVGFYRSKYKVGEESRYMAVTQFEPVDARRAFPCWDDPSFKTVFKISVEAPIDRIAVSNMPVKNTTQKDGKTIYYFDDTPKMSTYLVCVCVGEFEHVEAVTNDGVKVRVYTVPGKKNQADIALTAGVKSLEMFTAWFGIKYPLPKLDLLAIPDFSGGAMENWGAVTYRETALLAIQGVSATSVIQNACRTIAHEIAHQWFGNLVTMEWWSHLWLNEGFARWAETLCLDTLHPDWNFWMYFVANPYTAALNLDSLLSSHPIEVEVQTEAQISEIFDSISYAKGASVIRMLAAYLGLDIFRKGLNHYLSRHQYANTLTKDLWAALSEISGQDVGTIMTAWTQVTGYPIVLVEQVKEEGSKKTFRLKQARYLRTGFSLENAQTWQIPFTIRVQADKAETANITRVVMKEKEQLITLEVPDGSWVTFNDSQTGLYRVHYPADYLDRLGRAIQNNFANPQVRLGVQDDVFAAARAGLAHTPLYLSLLKYYQNETEYYVWSNILSNLSLLDLLYSSSPFTSSFRSYVSKLLRPLAQKLGWEPQPTDGINTGTLRSGVISLLALCEDEETLREGDVRFRRVLLDGDDKAVPPDLKGTVYRIGVNRGVAAERYDLLLKRYLDHPLAEEQRRCLHAIGSTKDSTRAIQTLEMLLSGVIKAQDMSLVAAFVASSSPQNKVLAWNWLKTNWNTIFTKFGDGLFVFAGLIGGFTGSFVEKDKADDIELFFETHPAPRAARTIQQSVEKIRASDAWITRDSMLVQEWLHSNGY